MNTQFMVDNAGLLSFIKIKFVAAIDKVELDKNIHLPSFRLSYLNGFTGDNYNSILILEVMLISKASGAVALLKC